MGWNLMKNESQYWLTSVMRKNNPGRPQSILYVQFGRPPCLDNRWTASFYSGWLDRWTVSDARHWTILEPPHSVLNAGQWTLDAGRSLSGLIRFWMLEASIDKDKIKSWWNQNQSWLTSVMGWTCWTKVNLGWPQSWERTTLDGLNGLILFWTIVERPRPILF